ncbi:unnamed protein product [Lactuca virosa]|uniref:Uncharacterized protein n=1 Tax=Lactuca virosa TaxID=75947 RepID=A0AAU9M7Q0_9ASTR|nr:unnamed protein product [Lactuca virosa]
MGGRKDFRVMYFAFIRFRGVEDVKALEDRLQSSKFGDFSLHINLSRHKRKSVEKKQDINHHPRQKNFPPPPVSNGMRNQRSYAQDTGGLKVTQPLNNLPITLNSKTLMNEWIDKKTLIGEAHSFDHNGNLPASLLMNEETKYLGGLSIALGFGNSMEARYFLEEKNRWKDWFKWMICADEKELPYVRTAWMKILGHP